MWHRPRILRVAFAAVARNIIGTITHVTTRDAVAALTFDDGPHPVFTPRLLEILKRHDASATFFMVGEKARRHPELVRQVAKAGHAIGNHSWDHSVFPLLTGAKRRAQMRSCANALAPYGQRLFRSPHGYQSVASRLDALWLRYEVVAWNVVADDWCSLDPEWMAERMVKQIQPGSVILLHDGLCEPLEERYLNREPMLEAVNILLEHLGGRFRFVTIPELLRHGRPHRANLFWKPTESLA